MYHPDGRQSLITLINLEKEAGLRFTWSGHVELKDDKYFYCESISDEVQEHTFDFYKNSKLIFSVIKSESAIEEYSKLGIFELVDDDALLLMTSTHIAELEKRLIPVRQARKEHEQQYGYGDVEDGDGGYSTSPEREANYDEYKQQQDNLNDSGGDWEAVEDGVYND